MMRSNTWFVAACITICCLIFACNNTEESAPAFDGTADAVAMAEQMFDAIGGKAAWCDLRSLYIKAQHTEPQMDMPYTSEIWRGIDTFQLVIEQQNDSFHVKGVFTPDGGTIRYYDKRDTFRTLTLAQLENWSFDNKHNVYVLLHDLACDPSAYRAKIDQEGRIAFHQDTTFVTSFGLDSLNRPHMFYRPNPDGSVSGSIFTHWGTDHGLVHSAGGHPLDSNFIYRTEIWQPTRESLRASFGEAIFDLQ